MINRMAQLEFLKWGQTCIPGIIFHYAKELELGAEDIGILAAIFHTLERTRPLYQTGVEAGQILRACPSISNNKLSKRLSRLAELGIISLGDTQKSFVNRIIYLEPMMKRLEDLVIRDHALLEANHLSQEPADAQKPAAEYMNKAGQMELPLEEKPSGDSLTGSNQNYRIAADFISKKTGHLMSVKMATELRKWLEELDFSLEFLLCMLELAFERSIYNPHDITVIAKDLKAYSINSVEGLDTYFSDYIDSEKGTVRRKRPFDPDIVAFDDYTGIDMKAEARRKIYYKWRYDWGFSQDMIMKAGEVMCKRTKNGGLEYIDSVLFNWMSKEIRTIDQADAEIKEFKSKPKAVKSSGKEYSQPADDYELYVPPAIKAK